MNRNQSYFKWITRTLVGLFIIGFNTHNLLAQTAEQEINTVFNTLVEAYGNAKSAPTLEILEKRQKSPAVYYASPSPIIKVDRYLFEISKKLDNNYRDALSVILSHELAHYYNDHTFCTDFAFAVRNESANLSSKLKAFSKTEKLALETEADHQGLFYAAMAGYKPFNIYSNLLDLIYQEYQLSEHTEGYPSKTERKTINSLAQGKITDLYEIFQKGMIAGKNGDYETAILKFDEINKYFPSRENYNNLGVSKTLKALKFKPISRAAYFKPERFTYPISMDSESRLEQPTPLRSIDEVQQREMQNLLQSAQKDFEKAISLDRDYIQSYINLASVFDLLGNPEAAIGKIKELPKFQQEQKQAQQILAIAYYNVGWEEKAEEIWMKLDM